MHLIDILLLIGSPILSGLAYFIFKRKNDARLKLLLSFSGSYLFAISVLHLIPEIYQGSSEKIGLFILIGFFIQIILEYFSDGIEHGHVHVHHHHDHHSHKFPLFMMISLSLHSFLEGMPLTCNESTNFHLTVGSFLLGIFIHNLPISYALVSMLDLSGIKKQTSILMLLIFSAMAPLGAWVNYLLSSGNLFPDVQLYSKQIMAIVVGIFLHISTTILFESSENHRFNMQKLAVILAGALAAIALEL